MQLDSNTIADAARRIGIKPEEAIQRFITQMPRKFTVPHGPTQLCAVVIDVGEDGRAQRIRRLQVSDD